MIELLFTVTTDEVQMELLQYMYKVKLVIGLYLIFILIYNAVIVYYIWINIHFLKKMRQYDPNKHEFIRRWQRIHCKNRTRIEAIRKIPQKFKIQRELKRVFPIGIEVLDRLYERQKIMYRFFVILCFANIIIYFILIYLLGNNG